VRIDGSTNKECSVQKRYRNPRNQQNLEKA
jgi:hypothetical protein